MAITILDNNDKKELETKIQQNTNDIVELNKIKDNLIEGGKELPYNMLNPAKFQLGTINMNGIFKNDETSFYCVTDYIELKANKVYSLSYTHPTLGRYLLSPNRFCVYGTDKMFIEQSTNFIGDDTSNYKVEKKNLLDGSVIAKLTVKKDILVRLQCDKKYNEMQMIEGEISTYINVYVPQISKYTLIKDAVVGYNIKDNEITKNKLSLDLQNSLSLFPQINYAKLHTNVLFIGDSLTEGYHTQSNINPNKSYPKYMSQICNWNYDNQGQSGITTLGWWNAYKDTVDFTKYDAVFIYLGTNGGLTDTVEQDTTSGDFNTFAQTNTGGYCAIISKIKSVNPKAKIYIIKYGDSNVSKITQKIADKYQCPTFIVKDTRYFNLVDNKYHTDLTHFNSLGYFCFAMSMAIQLEEYVSKNLLEYVDLK